MKTNKFNEEVEQSKEKNNEVKIEQTKNNLNYLIELLDVTHDDVIEFELRKEILH
ncbi:hypothetical protein [Spiroplasma endosymbiont of Danaus chrysippus]|uniref:hypothetical protein n=1 Tax=Spiroplasma endosymbiont of Danaus chrysippus TaxID=2691041 RepID=UPI00157A30EF|nr:hypothetical protein [Spiroplasma endosymbiont of Danaus chrysippus]